MQATALICDEKQRFTLEPVELDGPADDQIAVRTITSGVSIGTEFALIRNKISWGPYPLCTGYMAAGVVEAVGAGVQNFRVGDRVYWRGNDTMRLQDGTRVSCVSGAHCSRAVLKPNTTHGADHLPDATPFDVGSMFVMPAVGLYGVDMAQPRLGEVVVVHGCGLIGLGVVAACIARGCTVIAVDLNERALALAREFGADVLVNARTQDVGAEVRKIAPDGADVVFECTGIPACVGPAIELCRPLGAFVWQGNYGAAPMPFSFLPAHGRRLRMFFPCDDGLQPCRRAVVRSMALGILPWAKAITHRIEAADAPALFARIHGGNDPSIIGVVIRWSD